MVRQGDSAASIAYEHGFFWQTIWDHPDNTELREARENPNVLNPGDVIFIPDKERKEVTGQTGKCHRFRRKGIPEKLRVQLLNEDDEPRSNLPYILDIDGDLFRGETDGDGFIEQVVPPNSRHGRLILGESEDEEYQLQLGHLDPSDHVSGIQERLKNLGIYDGEITGAMDGGTIDALREFQREKELEQTGELDDETRQQLEALHVT
jgi:N-acetylmuramoyl-L-alanine amidase